MLIEQSEMHCVDFVDAYVLIQFAQLNIAAPCRGFLSQEVD